MRIYIEDSIGNTYKSLQYLARILVRHPYMKIVSVSINNFTVFSFEVHAIDQETDENIYILLSGLNCGYNGTGPNGSIEALKMLGIPYDKFVEKSIKSHDICFWHRSSGWVFKKVESMVQEVKA